jgi:gamma-glutamylcyclotransferase (GGCT)/AIG2-like uncharacterized protein YtfP
MPRKKPTPMTHRVFVYGTLKTGYGNNALFQWPCVYKGKAVTIPRYRMLEPSFPVILADPDGKPVAGEVYHVDDNGLARLDRLEGIRPDGGGMYTREIIEVACEESQQTGCNVSAYIYVGGEQWARSGCPAYTKVNANGALDWDYSGRGA